MRAAGRRGVRRPLALAVVLLAIAGGCADDGPTSLPLTGTGLSNPGISVTRTVTETSSADTATVVVEIEVPLDEFDNPPNIDASQVVAALAAAGFPADTVTIDPTFDFGVEVRVDVVPADVARAGPVIVEAVETATEVRAVDSGVVFSLNECRDLVADLRVRAISDAKGEAELLAGAAEVALGPIIGLADVSSEWFGPVDQSECPGGAGLGNFSFDPFSTDLASFDSPLEAEVRVTLTVTYGVGGMASESGSPAASISTTGSATVSGDADEAFVVAYVDMSSIESVAQLADDLAEDLADFGVVESDIEIGRGYDAVVQVRLDVGRVAEDGQKVIDAIESAATSAYDYGVWYRAEACPDMLDEARTAAYEDALEQAESLASSTGVDLGAPIHVSDSSLDVLLVLPDRCEDMPVDTAVEGYSIELKSFDDEPRLDVEVRLDVAFGITE
jgi:uncharacterized protein YggE